MSDPIEAARERLTALIEKWRGRAGECAKMAAHGSFPEGYSAEERAMEECADDLETFLTDLEKSK